MPITYPRPCPTCGVKIKNRCNYARHKKYCGKTCDPVPCPHCEATFTRKDGMMRHVKQYHSEAAQQRALELQELNRLELLHGDQIPTLTEEEEEQTGGAATTRSQTTDSGKRKREDDDDVDMSSLLDDEGEDTFLVERAKRLEEQQDPLFKADLTFMPYQRQGLKGAVKKQQFSVNFKQLRPPHQGENLGDGLSESLFQATRDNILQENLPESTKVHLTLTSKEHNQGTVKSDSLLSNNKYGIPVKQFIERGDYVHTMFESLAQKMNSAQNMNPAVGFNATLTFITYPEKGGKGPASKSPGRIPFDLLHKKKKSAIQIKNSDNLCCARAIVTMKEFVDGDPHKQYDNLRRGMPIQERLAKLLHRDAEVPEGPCGLEELQQFQTYLGPQGYKIIVVDYTSCAVIFRGQVKKYPKVINLVKHNNHYNGVKNMATLLNRSYFCNECCKGFNNDDAAHHSCNGKSCQSCQRTPRQGGCPDYASNKTPTLHCKDCRRNFYGPDCLDAHKTVKGQSCLCDRLKKCLECCKVYEVHPNRPHKCYVDLCRHCHHWVNVYEHKCHIQTAPKYEESYANPEEESDDSDDEKLPPLFVYADIECLVEPKENGKKLFFADHIRYSTSEDPPNKSHPFSGEDCISQFIDTLYGLTEVGDYTRDLFVIFHNLKGFDGSFIQDELYKRGTRIENQLTIGAKTLMFNIRLIETVITFKDSLCFLPMPLAQLPETFNFQEQTKGFFPHAFHTRENLSYRGPLPAKHHFQPRAMKPKTKKAFETWYATEQAKNTEYVLWEELETYCHSDVMVLKTACEKFITEFKEEAGFNPIEKCATIASACNLFWRRELVPKNTIAIEPTRGWRGAQTNQSKVALEWLCYEDSKLGHHKIKHVRSGGEQSLPVEGKIVKVDGYNPETNTVYEFHGCFYHACPECFPRQRHRRHNCHPDRSLAEVYEETCKKTKKLRDAGYTVFEKWEHDFEDDKKTDPVLKEFLSTFELVEPLNPRDSFFGGRTNGVTLYCETGSSDQEIRYADINSLYPYVNKTKTYPVGHPEILVHPTDQNIQSYFGIAKVKILPPAILYHPVLPVRISDKLMFPLCSQCVVEQLQKPWLERSEMCLHTEEERCLYGTWCTPELEKAVKKGYQILKIYEVWHFPESQRRQGLFADYVNKWLKIKQEASGWPKDCTTDQKKEEYLQEYEEREGVNLEPEKVIKNGGRKQVAKLMLNSFWGKFGEKPNKTQTHTVTSPAELYNIIENQGNNIHDIRIITEDVVEVDTTKATEEVIPSSKTNIFIASFTTAWARLELYSYLDKLKEQVLYFDTDSIIYRWRHGFPEIETGPFLGQMKDELEGETICEFVTGGPKNYAYKLAESGKTECKIRGFTQDEQGMELLNFESIKEHVLGALRGEEIQPIAVPVSINMVTDRTTKKICLTPKEKRYRLVFEKRVVNTKDYTSKPYGYYWIRDCLDSLIAL